MSDPAWVLQYDLRRDLDGGETYLIVLPLTYGRARLAVANEGGIGEHW